MNQILQVVRSSKMELVYGGGFSVIIISSMSINILFGFKGIKGVVITLFSWFAFMIWNKNIFWFTWYSGSLWFGGLMSDGDSLIWKLKYGYGARFLYIRIVSFFNAISVACGQWRVIMECKTELLAQLCLCIGNFLLLGRNGKAWRVHGCGP